jgi:hypothetical protein
MAIPLQMDKNPENSWSLQVAVLQGFAPTTLLKGVDLES